MWDEASSKAKQKLHDTGELTPKTKSGNPFTPDKGGRFLQKVTMDDGTLVDVTGTVTPNGIVRISNMWIQ